MRTLILIVILLLIVTNGEQQFQFGDMIAFKRLYAHGKDGFYKHYAVYVGDKDFNGKRPGDNIFEFTETIQDWFTSCFKSPIANCVFRKYDQKLRPLKDNYPDNVKNYKAGSEADITKRINEKYRDCGLYEPRKNNCEHLATYVRYGKSISVQHGTQLEGTPINDIEFNTKEMLEIICQKNKLVCESSTSTSNRKKG